MILTGIYYDFEIHILFLLIVTLIQPTFLHGGDFISLSLLVLSFSASFLLCRPPGHHSEYTKCMGFCHFNNVAIATEHALNHLGLQR